MNEIRKKIIALAVIASVLTVPTSISAYGGGNVEGAIPIVIGGYVYDVLDGSFMVNNRVLVPIREISQKFGAKVDWNADNQTVTINKSGTTIVLTINSDQATLNGETVTLDAPATIIKNATCVPLRFIGDALQIKVAWDNAGRRVIIDSAQ